MTTTVLYEVLAKQTQEGITEGQYHRLTNLPYIYTLFILSLVHIP